MADGRIKNGGRRPGAGRKSSGHLQELEKVMKAAVRYEERVQTFEILSAKARSGNIPAIALLLSYLYGKPIERTEITGEDGDPIQVEHVELTPEQRANRITELLNTARARRARQTPPK